MNRLIPLLILALALPSAAQTLPGAMAALPELGAPEQTASPQLSLDLPVDRELYLLGPGDRLLLVLEGRTLRRIPLTVLPEGILDWEGGLREEIGGLSLAEADSRVAELLGPWMPDVEISLLLVEPRWITAHLTGQVLEPGPVQLRATERISAAIQAAGGVAPNGSQRFVDLRGIAAGALRLDLYDFSERGDWRANPYCPAGSIVDVPVRSDTVQVFGEINRPGTYEVAPGETVADLLDLARGLTRHALPDQIMIERDRDAFVLDLGGGEQGGRAVAPGDVIIVGSRTTSRDHVYLEGVGLRDGRIALSGGEALGDLLLRIGSLGDSALIGEGILERWSDGRDSYLRFDLESALAGQEPANEILSDGDVLYIPARTRSVFVLGEVNEPGPLPFHPTWTAGRYLARAGGPTASGSYTRLFAIDREGNRHKIAPDDLLQRGDILFVRKSTLATITDFLLPLSTITSLALAISALTAK